MAAVADDLAAEEVRKTLEISELDDAIQGKVLSLLEGCLDLILSPSNSNKGCKKYWKSGVWILAPESQKFKKICSFVWRIWKWKEKGQKHFWPSGPGIRTPDFQ